MKNTSTRTPKNFEDAYLIGFSVLSASLVNSITLITQVSVSFFVCVCYKQSCIVDKNFLIDSDTMRPPRLRTKPHILGKIRAGFSTYVGQIIDRIEINNPKIAQLICRLIPPSCPFARTVKIFGHKLFSIPPLCHYNPLYAELIALRFRALVFLSEQS